MIFEYVKKKIGNEMNLLKARGLKQVPGDRHGRLREVKRRCICCHLAVCEIGEESVLYPQWSAANFSAQKITAILGSQRKAFWSHFTITYQSLELQHLYFFPDFSICGCLPLFLTLAEVLETENKNKLLSYFTSKLFAILGSKFREQSRFLGLWSFA